MPGPSRQYLFTSESVTEGHPDKVADQISDGVLDAVMREDPHGRVACETLVNTGLVVVSGEISTTASFDVQEVARETIRQIGYTDAALGFSADSCAVLNAVDKQSADIAQGVNEAYEQRSGTGAGDELDAAGAGDQGMMFGYASNETPELMPLPIALAHRLARRLSEVRKDGTLPYLRPDGKTQVSVRYVDGRPVGIEKLLISTQHAEGVQGSQIKSDLWEHVVVPVLPADMYTERDLQAGFLVNPTGRFVIGGPVGDCGLTGRKIIVDTYGGMARHGGGAFSGKDPSKVDRSAAYAARWVAKNLVAAGLSDRAEVQVAYAIGVARPVSVMVETFGTEADGLSSERLEGLVSEHFDLRPAAFRQRLDLHRPIYQKTAAYGHFGRDDADFTWERTDMAEELRAAAGLTDRVVEQVGGVSITVVGSIAFDAVETPFGVRERMLGGAATHFALAASLFDQVRIVGPVGDDFGEEELAVLATRGSSIDDVERVAGGKTFFWKGKYGWDLNTRETLDTQLNVFEHFEPKLSDASRASEVLFLANIQPGLQLQVREQCAGAKFVALDSMNLWIDIARDELEQIISKVDCLILNDEELRQLTGKPNLISAAREVLTLGPSIVVAKQGEYGSALVTGNSFFALPAYPLEEVIDPTGAGDTFAGGFVGYIAHSLHHRDQAAGLSDDVLRNAMAYGTALASFNVERFGTEGVRDITEDAVRQRVEDLGRFAHFDHAFVELND